MWPRCSRPSTVTSLGWILAASSAKRGVTSSRVIGDPPEDAMTNAVRNKQPAFVEALQCISDLPLNPREALAIGRVETLVNHHGADDIGRVDRRPRPPKRVEHAPRQFSMLEPEIGLPGSLRRDRLRLQSGSKQAQCGVKMNEISAAISARLLTNADTTWLSAMFHPRSRNDQGDYCRQADLMSAQRLVCLRHDAGNVASAFRMKLTWGFP